MRGRAAHFPIVFALLGSAVLINCTTPWKAFTVMSSAVSKVLLPADGALTSASTLTGSRATGISQRPFIASKLHVTWFGVGVLIAGGIAGATRRRRFVSARAASADDLGENDDLLVQAGLRNLLGTEENRMAQKLEEACVIQADMERCMNDMDVKNKLTMEELVDSRAKALEMEVEQDGLKNKLSKATDELTELKNRYEKAIQDSKKELSELKAELEAAKDANEQMVGELQTVKNALETMQTEKTAAESTCDELTAQVEKTEEAVAQAEKDSATQLADLKLQIETSGVQLADEAAAKKTLEAKLAQAQDELIKEVQSKSELEAEISKFEAAATAPPPPLPKPAPKATPKSTPKAKASPTKK